MSCCLYCVLRVCKHLHSAPHDCIYSLHDENVNPVHGDQEHGLPPGRVYTGQINSAQCQTHTLFGVCSFGPECDKCCVKKISTAMLNDRTCCFKREEKKPADWSLFPLISLWKKKIVADFIATAVLCKQSTAVISKGNKPVWCTHSYAKVMKGCN